MGSENILIENQEASGPNNLGIASVALPVVKRWDIVLGNFFFRYRNALFPAVYIVLLLTTRPKVIFGNQTFTMFVGLTGACLAILGQTIRLFTIGYQYIERGGKNGKVYASELVRGGVYAHVRNPMYVGNGLIAIGFLMFSGAPIACLVGIPFFLLVYQTITSAEENYLSSKFGKYFSDYCSSVNRFFPIFKNLPLIFRNHRYDWKRALRKEYGTMTVVMLLFCWISLWRHYFLGDQNTAAKFFPLAVIFSLSIFVAYVFVRFLKKSGRLESQSL